MHLWELYITFQKGGPWKMSSLYVQTSPWQLESHIHVHCNVVHYAWPTPSYKCVRDTLSCICNVFSYMYNKWQVNIRTLFILFLISTPKHFSSLSQLGNRTFLISSLISVSMYCGCRLACLCQELHNVVEGLAPVGRFSSSVLWRIWECAHVCACFNYANTHVSVCVCVCVCVCACVCRVV